MDERQAGITALVTAYARAYHATHDDPKIFDDFMADQLYTPEEHVFFDQNLASLLPQADPELAATNPSQQAALAAVMQLYSGPVTLGRSRYTEDCLEAALRQGARQYAILGAGFDTFTFRRPDLAEQVQVFEVDHPVTQAMKRERIAAAGWELPANLHFTPVDFSRESLAEALGRSGYKPGERSFFSWLGVTFYLTREAVFETLRSLASSAVPGSTLVFDYMDPEAFMPEKAGRAAQLIQAITQQVGEPLKAGFDPGALAGELRQAGCSLVENLDPPEIEARYFRGRADRYHANPNVHFARLRFG